MNEVKKRKILIAAKNVLVLLYNEKAYEDMDSIQYILIVLT